MNLIGIAIAAALALGTAAVVTRAAGRELAQAAG
jgi:hypothetical protein